MAMDGRLTTFPAKFPADVWGVVTEYASDTPMHALLTVALVHPEARAGVEACDSLWYRFVLARWPNAKPRAGTFTAFRARCRAILAADPIPASELHPIERCHVEFACPYSAEGKGIRLVEGGSDPELENRGLPVFYCSICNDHVFTVDSQEALDARVKERRCVMIPNEMASVKPDAYSGTAEVVVCATEEDVARRFVRAMKAVMLSKSGGMGGIRGVSAGSLSVESDNFVWERRYAPTVRIRAFWSAKQRFDATAPQTSLLLVVSDGKNNKRWEWSRAGVVQRSEHEELRVQQEREDDDDEEIAKPGQSEPLYMGRIEAPTDPSDAVYLLHRCFPVNWSLRAMGLFSDPDAKETKDIVREAIAVATRTNELILRDFDTYGDPLPLSIHPSGSCTPGPEVTRRRGHSKGGGSRVAIGTPLPADLAESLTILNFSKIEYWEALDGKLIAAMPALQKLRIASCQDFKSIPQEVFTSLSRLEELILNDLPELRELPDVQCNPVALRSLVVLDLQGCDIQWFDAAAFLSSPGAPSLRKLLLAKNPGLSMTFPPIKELAAAAPRLTDVSLENRSDLFREAKLRWEGPGRRCQLQVKWGTHFPIPLGDGLFLGTASPTKFRDAAVENTMHYDGISGYVFAARGLEHRLSDMVGSPWLALSMDDCPEAELVTHFHQACQFLDRTLRGVPGGVLVCGDSPEDARGLAVVLAYRMWQSRPKIKTVAEVLDELPPAEANPYPGLPQFVVNALEAYRLSLVALGKKTRLSLKIS